MQAGAEPVTKSKDFLGACMAFCCTLWISLGIISSVVAFFIFGIIFLVRDRNVCGSVSPLWVFGIVYFSCTCFSCICQVGLSLFLEQPSTEKGKMDQIWTQLFIGFFFTICLFIYESIILFSSADYVCENMKHSGLYTWSLVTWYFLGVCVTFFLLCMLCVGNLLSSEILTSSNLKESDPLIAEEGNLKSSASPSREYSPA